jgi:hypothetical protein
LAVNQVSPEQPLFCASATLQQGSDVIGLETMIRSVERVILNYIPQLISHNRCGILLMPKFLSVGLFGKQLF